MPTQAAQDPVRQGPGEMFGPYRLEAQIGRGGMGEVFRAYDTGRQRTVALKRLHAGLAEDGEYQERFRRESRLAARLSSPHVIPIHDYGEIEGSLFIDMRLVSGIDLGAEIERRGRLEPARTAVIIQQIADALDAAHDDGLVHRDVKPSNVLLVAHRGRDFVYLVDFGIVRSLGGDEASRGLTGTGLAIGTLSYMAPEMFLDGVLDRRADVYALGCVLFEALAGRPPFTGEGPALMYEHLHATPPPLSTLLPGIPPAVDAVLARGMAKDPSQRYATAGDLADAAHQALTGGHDVSTSGPQDAVSFSPPLAPTPRRSGSTSIPSQQGSRVSPDPVSLDPVSLDKGAGGAAPWTSPHDAPSGPVLPPGHPSGPQRATPTALGPAGYGPSGPHGPVPPGAPYGGPPGTYGYGGWGPGAYPGMPQQQPPRRRGATAAWVAVAVLATVVVLFLGLAVIGFAMDDTSSSSGSGGSTPSSGPSVPTSAAPAAASGETLRAAFPDVATRTCERYTPQNGEYRTAAGVSAVAVFRCPFAEAAPNAYVYFVQWPDQNATDTYQSSLSAAGPSIDGTVTWGPGAASYGPLYTRQSQGFVYASGSYAARPFGFDIVTSTVAERDTVLGAMRLLPPEQMPLG